MGIISANAGSSGLSGSVSVSTIIVTIGDSGDIISSTFGDELLAIDVDALITLQEIEQVHCVDQQLKGFMSVVYYHMMTSLPLTADQLERFLLEFVLVGCVFVRDEIF